MENLHLVDAPGLVLAIGAHCDDIEIGCAGTLARLARRLPDTHFVCATLSSDAEREGESRAAAARLLAGVRNATIEIKAFRSSYFPSEFGAIKDYFETLKARFKPSLIFTHYRHDLHQDHRVASDLAWNTFRNHLILEYEIPKFDGDLGVPQLFVPLSRAELDAKCDLVLSAFASQASRAWFSRGTFEALARLRGIECNAPDGFAEAFFLRKACLDI